MRAAVVRVRRTASPDARRSSPAGAGTPPTARAPSGGCAAAALRHAGRRRRTASGSSPTSGCPRSSTASTSWAGAPHERAVDFFFSFRSPYSYLAAPRAFALAERHDVEVVFRGVIPMAMRGQSVPVAKRLHTLRDVKREADRLGMPFGRIHDPIGDGALRCLLVSEHATDAGRVARVRARGEPRRSGPRRSTSPRDAGAAPRLRARRPRLGRLRARRCGDPALRARVDANTERLAELGHWGVPVLRPRRRALLGPGPHRGRRARPRRQQEHRMNRVPHTRRALRRPVPATTSRRTTSTSAACGCTTSTRAPPTARRSCASTASRRGRTSTAR